MPNGTSPHDSSRSTPTKQIPRIVCGGTTGQPPGGYWIVQVIGGTLPFMRAIRRFTVRPVLPDALAALGELAGNLRWSWHPPPRTSSPRSTPSSGRRPGATRCGCSARWATPGSRSWPPTRASSSGSGWPRADLERYLTEDRWYQRRGGNGPASIAYFSPEFGITAVLPQYSGGLGILAGDHLKAASDLGVPIDRRRPALPARLLQAVALAGGLAAGDLPGARPRRAADLAAARRRRHARHDHHRAARAARTWWP